MTRVAVTGVGVLSAFGDGLDALWRGLVEGRPAVRRIPRLVAARLAATSGGEVTCLPQDTPDRDVEMARRPLVAALAQSGWTPAQVGLVWATGLNTFAHGPSGPFERSAGACFSAVARGFGRPRQMVATACASSTQAIGEAFHLVRRGAVAACVAGGSSVMLSPFYAIGISWLQAVALDRQGEDASAACRPFDRQRRGFVIGDGGAAVVLEAIDVARARGAPILAEVIGFGVSQDAFDLNRPPPDGAGAELAIRRALADGAIEPTRISAVNAHGTGTRAGDPAEAAALRRVLGNRWQATPVSSCKGAIGHGMAAAGAIEAVAAINTLRAQVVPPTCNLAEPDGDCELDHVIGRGRSASAEIVLSCSFGMGGQNAAVVFGRAQ